MSPASKGCPPETGLKSARAQRLRPITVARFAVLWSLFPDYMVFSFSSGLRSRPLCLEVVGTWAKRFMKTFVTQRHRSQKNSPSTSRHFTSNGLPQTGQKI